MHLRRRRRLPAGLRAHLPRRPVAEGARDLVLHDAEAARATARRRAGHPDPQDRVPRVEDLGAVLRERLRGDDDRRRGRGVQGRDWRPGHRPGAHRGPGDRPRQGRPRGRDRLREATRPVRTTHRAEPGHPVPDRRHGHAGGRGPQPDVPGLHRSRCGPDLPRLRLHGQALRLGDGREGDQRRLADPRRKRLHHGLPGRAVLAGRPPHQARSRVAALVHVRGQRRGGRSRLAAERNRPGRSGGSHVAVGSGAVHTIVVGGPGESIRSAKLCLPGPAVGAATATGRAARRRTRTRRSPARAEAAGPRCCWAPT